MSPDLNRPDLNRPEQPVYRPSNAATGRGGMDPATRRLSIIAGFIGAVLLALVGGWSLTARHAGGVPVIEAATTPVRVKPADPGGMQLTGAEPPPAAGANGGTALAPGPETPDPQALHAELDRARQADTEPPAPVPQAQTQTQTQMQTKPEAPAAVPVAVPAPQPAPEPAATRPSGHVEVQLAAMDSEALARTEWARLAHKNPSLFADRTPLITQAVRDGRTFYRLRTGGFETVAAATGFCERTRAVGAACTIAAF